MRCITGVYRPWKIQQADLYTLSCWDATDVHLMQSNKLCCFTDRETGLVSQDAIWWEKRGKKNEVFRGHMLRRLACVLNVFHEVLETKLHGRYWGPWFRFSCRFRSVPVMSYFVSYFVSYGCRKIQLLQEDTRWWVHGRSCALVGKDKVK